MPSPNILVIMTDEERYPPPYEGESLASPMLTGADKGAEVWS